MDLCETRIIGTDENRKRKSVAIEKRSGIDLQIELQTREWSCSHIGKIILETLFDWFWNTPPERNIRKTQKMNKVFKLVDKKKK